MMQRLNDALRRLADRLWEPVSPRPLAILRILVCAVLIGQAISLAPAYRNLFASTGFVQGPLAEAFRPAYVPTLAGLYRWSSALVTEDQLLQGAGILYLLALLALLCGFWTRVAAIAAWFLHWTLMNSAFSSNYGVDTFAHIFLFYFIWMPVGNSLSLDRWRSGGTEEPSWQANLSLRVVQLHLCIVYVSSGLEKASGVQWWNGEAIWRSLMLPVYRQFEFGWIGSMPLIAAAIGLSTLVLEVGYPLGMAMRRIRPYWVCAIVAMHLGIAIFLGLHYFGLLMAALTLSAFGVPAYLEKKERGRSVQPLPIVAHA